MLPDTRSVRKVLLSRLASTAVIAVLAAGCARHTSKTDELHAAYAAYGHGVLGYIIPELRERPLATPANSRDSVVRVFHTQGFGPTGVGRIERRSGHWFYVNKYHVNAKVPYVIADSVPIAARYVDSLFALIVANNGWRDSLKECSGHAFDGSSFTFEARIGHGYYSIDCGVDPRDSTPTVLRSTLATLRWLSDSAPRELRHP